MLSSRADQNDGCTLSTCPVERSIYGYRPNLAATVVFFILFFLSGAAYGVQNTLRRRWFFNSVMLLGSISEVLGYTAKLLLYKDPFSDSGFKMSVVLLTWAPAFYAAGIYYTFKHICLTLGPSLSRLPPVWYTRIFISADILSIIFQAMGGAIASAAEIDTLLFTAGDNIMITGLVTQVFTLLVFFALAVDYGFAVWRHHQKTDTHQPEQSPWTQLGAKQKQRFHAFLVALTIAYFGILIRCTYRVAELAQGWVDNPILRNEYLFIFLDSLPVALAALALNISHPAWCLPTIPKSLQNKSTINHDTDSEVLGATVLP